MQMKTRLWGAHRRTICLVGSAAIVDRGVNESKSKYFFDKQDKQLWKHGLGGATKCDFSDPISKCFSKQVSNEKHLKIILATSSKNYLFL